MRAAQLLLIVLSGASCSLWPDGEFPPDGGGSRIPARPEYLLWWKLMEDCAGRRKVMDVQWFTTNGRTMLVDDHFASGVYRPYPDRIALMDPSSGPVARHEMLHAILAESGHPLQKFAGTCDGLIDFTAPQDFGASSEQVAAASIMRADSALKVVIRTFPESPSMSQFGGKFVFIAEMTNRSGKPVRVVTADPTMFVRYSDSKGVREFRRGFTQYSYVFYDVGQTRRLVLDGQVLIPGSFNMIAGYSRARSDTTKLVLRP